MPTFIPQFIQKRILRYALSQLDFIDTNSLSLDSLDIAWGRKSTIELRDVKLRAQAIGDLCKLPRFATVSQASLRMLRIHMPSDLLTSGLEVEATGVTICIKVLIDDEECDSDGGHSSNHDQHCSPDHSAPQENTNNATKHVMHDGIDSDADGEEITTTHKMMESYLQQESHEEKQELRHALEESQYFQSLGIEEHTSECGDLGMGEDIMLPAFLTDFVHSIVDKIQVSATDICIELVLDEHSAGSVTPKHSTDQEELPKMWCRIDCLRLQNKMQHNTTIDEPQSTFLPRENSCSIKILELENVRLGVLLNSQPAASLPMSGSVSDESPFIPVSVHTHTSGNTSGQSSRSQSVTADDLEQSKIFTHLEASSMYMSAMSDLYSSSPHINASLPTDLELEGQPQSECGDSSISEACISEAEMNTSASATFTTKPVAEISRISLKLPSKAKTVASIDADMTPGRNDSASELVIKGVKIAADFPLLKLIASITSRLPSFSQLPQEDKYLDHIDKPSRISFGVSSVSLIGLEFSLLENLVGRKIPDGHNSDPGGASFAESSTSFLKLAIGAVTCHDHSTSSADVLKCSVHNVSIHLLDQTLMSFQSFQPSLVPSHSSSTTREDISVHIESSRGQLRLNIRIRPIELILDLGRIKDLFDEFGGISGVLLLGGSMIAPLRDRHEVLDRRRPLGHRAKVSGSHPSQQPKSQTELKVTARLDGILVTLCTPQCSLRVQSSAIKIVQRSESVALQISQMSILLRMCDADFDAVTLRLTDATLRYSISPAEEDISRFLGLVSPTIFQATDHFSKNLMLDTLIKQRKDGGVLSVTISKAAGHIQDALCFSRYSSIIEDLIPFTSVTKYLPEDDRAGALLLLTVNETHVDMSDKRISGGLEITSGALDISIVTFPSLFCLSSRHPTLRTGDTKIEFLGPACGLTNGMYPTILARFVKDDLNPTVSIYVNNLRIDYMAAHLSRYLSMEDKGLESMAGSAILAALDSVGDFSTARLSHESSRITTRSQRGTKDNCLPGIEVILTHSLIGIYPLTSSVIGQVVVQDLYAHAVSKSIDAYVVDLELKRIEFFLQDVNNPSETIDSSSSSYATVLEMLQDQQFVSIGSMQGVDIHIQSKDPTAQTNDSPLIIVKGGLLLLETTADSTKSIGELASGLIPPKTSSSKMKYRTHVVPIDDLIASVTDNPLNLSQASGDDPSTSNFVDRRVSFRTSDVSSQRLKDDQTALLSESTAGLSDDSFLDDNIPDSIILSSSMLSSDSIEGNAASAIESLSLEDDYFEHAASHAHSSTDKTAAPTSSIVKVRDFHVIWNLYDGYDWPSTRKVLSDAIDRVQSRAAEQRQRDLDRSHPKSTRGENLIDDFLFNSIYIGVPSSQDTTDLVQGINLGLGADTERKDGTIPSTVRAKGNERFEDKRPRLQLKRSQSHKMTIELRGIDIEVKSATSDVSEVSHSLTVVVDKLEIFDHIPTSTWRKFLTYMHEAGEREFERGMINVELALVRPVEDLNALEVMLKVFVLPLRLHVDQDALDFLTRFFEFQAPQNGSTTSKSSTTEPLFFQRVEVASTRLKLDFKPKRLNYAALRSGHTSEFKNIFSLDQADIVLRRVILYGVNGAERLGKTLDDIWTPDIKHNQIPGVLAGLGPIRPLINVGGGISNLVVVPIREYQKDGRLLRSLQKGAVAFAKTTTSELLKFGAKLAVGTQAVLEGAEGLLTQEVPQHPESPLNNAWEEIGDAGAREEKCISHYAEQPLGFRQGLQGAYEHMRHDLLTAKDAIIAIPGEVVGSETAVGAARAVLKSAPTIILRPAVGVTKAVGQTLMGATNAIDLEHKRHIEDKYKR